MDFEALDRALAHVPPYAATGVREYLFKGIPPSGFLRAILENDLHKACLRADENNVNCLFGWGCVLNALPMDAWGNAKLVEGYLARHPKTPLPAGEREKGNQQWSA